MPLPESPSSPNTYGGAKADYLGAAVVDPTTDLAAADHNQQIADTAAMTQTATKAWAVITSANPPVLVSHGSQWGNAGGVAPVPARTSAGVYTVTWPTSITDGLGVVRTVNSVAADARPQGSTAFLAQATRTAANVATVYAFNLAGTASDTAGQILVTLR